MKRKNDLKLVNRRKKHLVYKGRDAGGRLVYLEFRRGYPNAVILSVANTTSKKPENQFFNHCWFIDYNKFTFYDEVEIFDNVHRAMAIPSYDWLDLSHLKCFKKDGGSGWYIRFKERKMRGDNNED